MNVVVELNQFRDLEVCEEIRTLISNILSLMLNQPDSLKVSFTQGEKTTIYKVDCHPDDFGHLLGKQGKNIDSLRKIVLAMMAKHGQRGIVEIPYFHRK